MTCNRCKKEYQSKYKQSIYCSFTCRKHGNNEKMRLYMKKYMQKRNLKDYSWKKSKLCKICDRRFMPKTMNNIYCSKQCLKNSVDLNFIMNNMERFKDSTIQQRVLKIRITVLDRDNFRCSYCGRGSMWDKNTVLHVDHKIPKTLGGTDDIDNLITSCSECNLGKSDVLLNIWKNKKGL